MIRPATLTPDLSNATRAYSQARMESMRSYRMPWWSYWAELALLYFPQKYRYFVTPNNYARGVPLNTAIVDETGLLAARVLATGLLSGLTSPTKPWFSLSIYGMDDADEGPARKWLAECTRRMLAVYAGSNFYQALGAAYHQMVVFGSAALIQYEDPDNVVHFCNPVLGEFFFALNAKLDVDTLYREYTYTVAETVKCFGVENVSPSTAGMFKSGGSNLDTEIVIGHAIEPNTVIYAGGEPCGYTVPHSFPYREVYWENVNANGGQRNPYLLALSGFSGRPFSGFRWDVTSNDAYGRSPGMDALPAVRQLQLEQRRKAEAIDKLVRPPMVASVSMKNEPMDIMPGGISYVADPAGSGFKPAFTVEPRIGEMMEDLKEVQARVQRVFFNDLFLGISQLGTVRTATEIEARMQETLIQIGPVIERTEGELDDIVDRTFSIMLRKGLFPPPPQEIQGAPITVKYVSLFAETQRAAATTAMERLAATMGSLAGLKPDVLDNVDWDIWVDTYASQLNVPPEVMQALAQVAQVRARREQAQQMQAALAVGTTAAQGAQTLSQADVGGGQNALQMMLGNAQ